MVESFGWTPKESTSPQALAPALNGTAGSIRWVQELEGFFVVAMKTQCIDHGQPGDKNGYGRTRHQGKRTRSHRVAFVKHHGLDLSDISGMVIRHECDNPRCINPKHLLSGTRQENMDDMSIRRRHGKLKLTAEQVLEIRATCRPSKRGAKPTGDDRDLSFCGLAKKFGVNHGAVRMAYLGRSHRFI